MYWFYIIVIIIFLPIGIYFYKYLEKLLRTIKIDSSDIFIKFLLIVATITIVLICTNIRSVWSMILMHLFFVSIFIDLIVFILGKILNKRKFRKVKKVTDTALIPLIITALIISFGYYNMIDIKEVTSDIKTEKSLSQDYKIVYLSDVHYGNAVNKKILSEQVNKINKLEPDLVILGGDIVDESTTILELYQVFSELSNINTKYGIYFVYGNHEVFKNDEFTTTELEFVIENNNINLLYDSSDIINNEITLIGRNDAAFARTSDRKTSEELLGNLSQDNYLIMLDHQPIDLETNAKLGYDLQLSGHTHGGQLFPIGIIDKLFKINEMNYGMKQIDDFQVIVSSGMSGWAYPIRTQKHSEYVVINLKSEK